MVETGISPPSSPGSQQPALQGGEEGADPLEEEARGSLRVISPQDINSNTATGPGAKRPAEAQEETGVTRRTFLHNQIKVSLLNHIWFRRCKVLILIASSDQVPRRGGTLQRRATAPL